METFSVTFQDGLCTRRLQYRYFQYLPKHYASANNATKSVLVTFATEAAQEFWEKLFMKVTQFYGFQKFEYIDGNETLQDCKKLEESDIVLEIGGPAPGCLNEKLIPNCRVIHVPIPADDQTFSSNGDVEDSKADDPPTVPVVWPERQAQLELCDKVLTWLESTSSPSAPRDTSAKGPEEWLGEAGARYGFNLDSNFTKRVLIIVNPIGGTHEGPKYVKEIVIPVLNALGISSIHVQETLYMGHTEGLAEELDLNKYDLIAIAGGDGTLAMTLRGLRRNKSKKGIGEFGGLDIPIAIIPTGTSNWLFSILDKYAVPFRKTVPRDIVAATLRIASTFRYKTHINEWELTYGKSEGTKVRSLNPVAALLGNFSQSVLGANLLKQLDNSIGSLVYTLGQAAIAMCDLTIPLKIKYLPAESKDAPPAFDNWEISDNWITRKGEFRDLMVWSYWPLKDPHLRKENIQSNYLHMFMAVDISHDRFVKEIVSIGFNYAAYNDHLPENVFLEKIKAVEIEYLGEATELWKCLINFEGEYLYPAANIIRMRICPERINLMDLQSNN